MAGSAPGGYEVHHPSLRRYAEIIAAQERRLQQVNAALAEAQVPAGAFGKLPESGELHSEYQAHAQAEVTNTAELPGLLEQVAEALGASADHYAGTEAAITQAVVSARRGGWLR
jgi:hypothetical protein